MIDHTCWIDNTKCYFDASKTKLEFQHCELCQKIRLEKAHLKLERAKIGKA